MAVAVSSLRDDAGTPADTADDFTPAAVTVLVSNTAYNVGDLDRDDLLDVDEVWMYRASGTVAAGQYTNNATVTVRDPIGGGDRYRRAILPTTSARRRECRSCKAVNAVEAAAADGDRGREQPGHAGRPGCRHDGGLHLRGPQHRRRLARDRDAGGRRRNDRHHGRRLRAGAGDHRGRRQVVYNTGDTNKNNLLDKTETWLFSATRTSAAGCLRPTTPRSAAVNTRTNVTVKDDDPANVFGAMAKIDIEKAINAVDPGNPTIAEDADDRNHPVVLNPGTPLTWTYLLSNAGNGPLTVNSIRDDAGTPTVTTDDFTPTAVLAGGFNIGDANRNNLLDVGEVWRYTSVGTSVGGAAAQLGLHTNTVTAVGTDTRIALTASDSDAASYLGQAGVIRIEKAINADDATRPTVAEDADSAPGPTLLVGTPDHLDLPGVQRWRRSDPDHIDHRRFRNADGCRTTSSLLP